MLYQPPKFRAEDPALAQRLVEEHPFALLVTIPPGATEPRFSHVPFLREGERLVGHVARANPQRKELAAGGPATVIFQGPHAYVSPRWYQPAPDNVPTWNYAVVHAYGAARVVDDPARAYAEMQKLVARFDPQWPLALSDADREELLAGIAVIEVAVERWDAKLKLSQNRDKADALHVATQLLRRERVEERDTGALMLRVLEGKG